MNHLDIRVQKRIYQLLYQYRKHRRAKFYNYLPFTKIKLKHLKFIGETINKMDYTTAMEKLAELLGRETYEMPHVEANMHHPQVPEALKAYVDACDALRKADIALAPIAEALYDHSKWHDNQWHDTQDWTEFRTFKHAFDTATDIQEEAYIALMDSLNMDFTG